jgi:hypothetical protein
MSQTLTIPDVLYIQLETTVRMRGLKSIEQLLELWQSRENELHQRQKTVRRIDALREQIFAKYGEMPDSTALIREDRER